MRELVSTLVRGLVREPDQVRVYEEDADGRLVFELLVAEGDRGRVIGREGRTVDALRTVLAAVARERGGGSCELEIID